MKSLLYILTLLTLTSCNNGGRQNTSSSVGSLKKADLILTNKNGVNFETREIICDSIYKNQGYKLTLKTFGSNSENKTNFNTIFSFYKLVNGNYSEIFSDSIFNKVQDVRFKDYNNDNVKDILVQNISDVRSNWTYYLYLVDPSNDKLRKVKGFEEIKNPKFLSANNLICNYVNSGRNWTEFYKIKDDSIFNFGITIYDGEDDKGKVTYDNDYKEAIKRILTNEKNNR